MKYVMILCLTFSVLIAQAHGQCNIVIQAEASGDKFIQEFKALGYKVVGNVHQADIMARIKVDRARPGENWVGLFITDTKTHSKIAEFQAIEGFRNRAILNVLYQVRTYFTPCNSGLFSKNNDGQRF